MKFVIFKTKITCPIYEQKSTPFFKAKSRKSFFRFLMAQIEKRETDLTEQYKLRGEKIPKELMISPLSYLNGFIITDTYNGHLNAFVPHPFNKEGRHLVALDCDSEDSKNNVEHYLNKHNFSFQTWESSPGKYWIFPDLFVSNIKCFMYSNWKKWEDFGIDMKYCKLVVDENQFTIRAYPRQGFMPRMVNKRQENGSEKWKNWLQEFREYWNSSELEEIFSAILIHSL